VNGVFGGEGSPLEDVAFALHEAQGGMVAQEGQIRKLIAARDQLQSRTPFGISE
jgi:hypothetical protein